jgi:uncharacterized protein YceK
MKKIQRWLIVMFVAALLLSGCQSTASTEEASGSGDGEKAFELYLVADEQLSGPDLKNFALSDLPLAEDPILTSDDLVSYIPEYHAMNLTEEAYQKMLAIFSMGMPMSGVPFVIVSKGDRIYAGAFWTPLSSLSVDGVVIMQPMDPSGAALMISLGYPDESVYTGEDPRNDPRLMNALEEAGLIEE